METQYLPSAKFIKVVLFTIAAIAIIFAISKGSPALRQIISDFWNHRSAQVAQKNEDAYANYRTLDTDKDGLLDWEEALYGTDPNNPDTDGNGTDDYQEANKGGSVISSDTSSVDGADVATTTTDSDNLTDSLARDLYTSLSIAKQQSGGAVSQEDTEKLATIAAQSATSFSSEVYSVADLRIVPLSAQSKSVFVSQFQAVLAGSPIQPSDLRRALEAIDYSATVPSDITARVKTYPEYIQKHLVLPVPSNIAPEYIQYINSLQAYLTAVAHVSNTDEDPVRAISAVVNINTVLDSLDKSEQNLRSKIR